MNQQVRIKAGYLKKQTESRGPASLLHRATRRWFVFLMFGGLPSLEYYEDEAAAAVEAPINSFDLRGCRRVTRSPDSPCSFLLALSNRLLTLTTDTEAEAAIWADTLDRNLEHLAARSKPDNIYGTYGDDLEDSEDDEGDAMKKAKQAATPRAEEADAAMPEPHEVDEEDLEGMKEMERLLSRDEVADVLRRLEDRLRRDHGEDSVRDLRTELQTAYDVSKGGGEQTERQPDSQLAELDSMDPAAYAVLEGKYRELEDWDELSRLRKRRFRSTFGVFRPNPDPPPYQHLAKPMLVSGFFDKKPDISVEETKSGQFVVNTLGPGGPRLSPLCAAVERLKRQILHPGGVQLTCRSVDLLSNVAIVQCANRLWIAGWNHQATRLHGSLHVGDQLVALEGFRLESLDHTRRILQGSVDRVSLRLRRLPHAKAFCVQRTEGRPLGLGMVGQGTEVAHVQQDGQAAAQGLAYRTPGVVDDANFTTWTLTEVNGRPLSLRPEPKEVTMRLCANGPEMSLVLQPTDLVRAIKAQLKRLPNYRQFVLR